MNWKPFRWNGMVLLIKLHIRRWWSFLNNINLNSDRWIQCYNLINIWLATWNSFHSSRNGSTLFFDKYDFNAIFSFFFFLFAYSSSSSVFSQRASPSFRVQSVSTFSSLGLRSMWDQLIHSLICWKVPFQATNVISH